MRVYAAPAPADPAQPDLTYELSAAVTIETATPDDVLRETYDLSPDQAAATVQTLTEWTGAYGAQDIDIDYDPARLTARVAPAHIHEPGDLLSRASLRISAVTGQPHTYVPDEQPGNAPLCTLILRCAQALMENAGAPSADELTRLLVRTVRADADRYDSAAARTLTGPMLDLLSTLPEGGAAPHLYRALRRHAANLYALANPHDTTFSYSPDELRAAFERDAAAAGLTVTPGVTAAVLTAMTTCDRAAWAEMLGSDSPARTPAAQTLRAAALNAELDDDSTERLISSLSGVLMTNMENKNRLEQDLPTRPT